MRMNATSCVEEYCSANEEVVPKGTTVISYNEWCIDSAYRHLRAVLTLRSVSLQYSKKRGNLR